MGSWRARCLATGTPGSEVRAGETDRPKGQHRAPARPYWYVLEQRGFALLLVNAHHVKILPGRKTDVGDAAWLCELLECGLLRGSFVPPPQIRQLRDLVRYRKRLIQAHGAESDRTSAMRPGCVSCWSVGCCAAASCPRLRSASCGILSATASG